IVTIGKNSALEIEKFLFDEKNAKNEAEISLSKGAFRTITGQIGKIAPETFKLKTRTTTIGVRGTQIIAEITDIAERFACAQGEITLTLNSGGGVATLREGEIATVESGAISRPRNFKPEEVLKIIEKIDGAPIVVNPNTFVMDADSAITNDLSSSGAGTIADNARGNDVSFNPVQDLSDAAKQVTTVSLGLYDLQSAGMSVPKPNVGFNSAPSGLFNSWWFTGSAVDADFVYMPNFYYVDPYVDWAFYIADNPLAMTMGQTAGFYGTKTDPSIILFANYGAAAPDKITKYGGEVTGRIVYGINANDPTQASSIMPNSLGQQNNNTFRMEVNFHTGKYSFWADFTAELTGERFRLSLVDMMYGLEASTQGSSLPTSPPPKLTNNLDPSLSGLAPVAGATPSEKGFWQMNFFGPNAESVAGLVEYERFLGCSNDIRCNAFVQLLVKGNKNR
ncbi:MAG: FecR family protein, partial [Helicobacteraceae bacterium]|nr:FecR family protein [Helicobacteraceae bacterium]